MSDFVAVPREALFKLCSRVFNLTNDKSAALESALKAESESKVLQAIGISNFFREDLDNLNDLLGLALNCAPYDIKDFFIHYDEVCGKCPF